MKTLLLLPWVATVSLMVAAETMVAAPAPNEMKLFLLIGQSNMAGRGPVEPQDQVPHPRVFVLNKAMAWAPAVDPLHWDKPEVAGVGLASTFGRAVAEEEKNTAVGLIPAAFGGTSLDQWAVGGELYTNAVARAREAMKRGKLVGILWHQGEADSAKEKVTTYTERFSKMIAQLRTDLEARDVPVIVGELGRFREKDASVEINAVLVKLPEHVPLCACASSEGLTDKGDKLHFDSASLREFGRRYEREWTRLVKR